MRRGVRLRRVEVLEEARCEDVTPLTEQESLRVGEGQDPGELRSDVTACPPVRPRDPARRQTGIADRGTPRSIGREEALERRTGEPSMTARGREDAEATGVAPAAERRRRDAEDSASLRQADPVGIARGVASHEIYANLPECDRLAHCTTFLTTRDRLPTPPSRPPSPRPCGPRMPPGPPLSLSRAPGSGRAIAPAPRRPHRTRRA